MACPRTKLDPLAEHRDSNGWWSIMCPTCCYFSSFKSQDLDYARFRFWQEHDLRGKEKTMYVPSDPHEAYRFGVRQATEPILSNNSSDDYLNETLAYRRKLLLTRKVTKWANVYRSPSVYDPAAASFGHATLFDSPREAKNSAPSEPLWDFVGTFPIEIEETI